MPMGPEPIGFAAFTAVKLIGYTAGAVYLRKKYENYKHGSWKIGAVRTLVGVVVGVSYGLLFMVAAESDLFTNSLAIAFPVLLVPVRMGEWSFVLWLFLERGNVVPMRMWKFAWLGTLWSFILDAIGIGTALVVPGGIWVC